MDMGVHSLLDLLLGLAGQAFVRCWRTGGGRLSRRERFRICDRSDNSTG
jgi:hypothetical protein